MAMGASGLALVLSPFDISFSLLTLSHIPIHFTRTKNLEFDISTRDKTNKTVPRRQSSPTYSSPSRSKSLAGPFHIDTP